MTIATAFTDLRAKLQRLREAHDALGMTVDADRPTDSEVSVASYVSDALLEARGCLQEACAALDLPDAMLVDAVARQALVRCHERFNAYRKQFAIEVICIERMDHLASVARERGRSWADWVDVVKQGLDDCMRQADQVADGVLACWEEVAQRQASGVAIQHELAGSVFVTARKDSTAAIGL